ncbi:tRNA (adenine(22)-N(1))-methyltransferase TrmK [Aerococcaceae bacterium DSM 111020]|nr:tRNA (adenine(22)-N(1))-methyltransferase TrmK [Aerococcaceae bacterium DSM 111020]
MNAQQLSARLLAVSNFIIKHGPKPIRLADIGTDHAYLPSYLMQKNLIEFAIAGDVVEGPLQSAKNEVISQGLQDKISVRLGDGLEVITEDDQINTVSICGMGGSLIKTILQQGMSSLTNSHVLVLQPNIGEAILRRWLIENDYQIIDETIIVEGRHDYEIIVAVSHSMNHSLSDQEILFGPINIKCPSEAFFIKWEREMKHRKKILEQMRKAKQIDSTRIERLEKEIQAIQEVINK